MESCLLWTCAFIGTVPARKYITGSGVLSGSFKRVLSVCLKCLSKTSNSAEFRVREATPESRTGRAKVLCTFSDAAWFALCLLARPACSTANSAFLCAETRSSMWGRFPEDDLTIPTCSAVSENLISLSLITSLDVNLENSMMVLCLGAAKASSLVFSGASMTWYLVQ